MASGRCGMMELKRCRVGKEQVARSNKKIRRVSRAPTDDDHFHATNHTYTCPSTCSRNERIINAITISSTHAVLAGACLGSAT